MKRLALGLIALVPFISVARCCVAQGMGGGGRGQADTRLYDAKTVETLSGEVVSVHNLSRRGTGAGGTHVVLHAETETIQVHLGPSWYLEQYFTIAVKDHLEVRGSRVTYQGQPAIIAAEVKKGDQIVKLREDDGRPLWRGKKP